MRNGVVAVLLVVVIALGVGTGYLVGASNQRTTTSVSTTTVSTANNKSSVFIMNVNGSLYYADDVSSDIEVPNPGYAYFLNASITFDGIRFQTQCPSDYLGCPGSTTGNATTITLGVASLNATFPNGSIRSMVDLIGDETYSFALTQNTNPTVGILVEYVEYNYHAFLLVSS